MLLCLHIGQIMRPGDVFKISPGIQDGLYSLHLLVQWHALTSKNRTNTSERDHLVVVLESQNEELNAGIHPKSTQG